MKTTIAPTAVAHDGPQAAVITAVVLAKNEEANISKCLRSLAALQIPTVVLDSGSTDRTLEIASAVGTAVVHPFAYINHLSAYRELTAASSLGAPWVLILDADMEMSRELYAEILGAIRQNDHDVVIAPVVMYVDGVPLRHGSLCPPKPIAFRTGREYFIPTGHGERLAPGLRATTTRSTLVHNDLKAYEAYLLSQVRYGRQLRARMQLGTGRFRDRLRASTPLMGAISALYSLIVRGGLFAGAAGRAYALDRLIAGLVQYRVCLEEDRDRDHT